MQGFFKKNLTALAEKNKGLYKELKEFTPAQDDYIIEETRNGSLTIKVKNEQDKFNYVYSKYNPQKDAEKWVNKQNFGEQEQFYIFGLGLGYHLQMLIKQVKEVKKIVVFEPGLNMLYYALQLYDYSYYLNNDILSILHAGEKSKIKDLMGDLYLNKVNFIELPVITLYENKKFEELKGIIRDHMLYHAQQLKVNIGLKDLYINNYKANLPFTINEPGIDLLSNKFKDIPYVLVAAGPSLNRNRHYLKEAKGKAVIAAVDTALKAVLEIGVKPDIVITLDPKPENWDHFEGIDYSDIFLFHNSVSMNKVLTNHKGDKYIYYNLYKLAKLVLDDNEERKLWTEGSVAHSALDLGVKMGCNPIVMIGQDLALAADGHTHASGTARDEIRLENKAGLLKAKGIDGKDVYTKSDFYSFLRSFEEKIKGYPEGINFIDATEGGALIEGTELMLFKDVITKYCRSKIGVGKKLKKIHDEYRVDRQGSFGELKEAKKEVKELIKISSRAIEKSIGLGKLNYKNRQAINHALKKLDEIDQEIKKNNKNSFLSYLVIISDLLNVVYGQKKISESPQEKVQDIAKLSGDFYKRLKSAYNFILDYLEEIEELVNKTGSSPD